ncbi:MAG: radical SAM protein [Candidatus Alcyoniella australis]|nr:radical SAM protein [Candidatus Alcyoniella australis]
MNNSMRTPCPECGRVLDGERFERDGALYVRRQCPEHGEQIVRLSSDADLYRRSEAASVSERLPAGDLRPFWGTASRFITTLALDVTNRCNLNCPICFADANAEVIEPTLEELERIVPQAPAKGFRPNLALVGGESTVRPDLPQIVELVRAKGYEPRLNSNGLALSDEGLLRELRRAGLRWVILQIDGLDPEISIKFRGRDLTAHKDRVLELLERHGFLVHFAMMVVKGTNDDQVGAILRRAMDLPHVRRVSFYPQSVVGRLDEHSERTDAADVLRAIERTTDGQVTPEDVLRFKEMTRRAFALTHHPLLRPRPCIFPFILQNQGGRLLPISRLFQARYGLSHPGQWLRLLAQLPGLARYDGGDFSSDLLICNIEKFYDNDAFDLDAGLNCHHVYLEGRGAFPFCYYNSFVRPGGSWPMGC